TGRGDPADRSGGHDRAAAHSGARSARRAGARGGGAGAAARPDRATQGRTRTVPRGARQLSYAYVDTSCLVALAFGEPGAGAVRTRLESYDRLYSANLLEAELRAAFAR